MYGVQWQLKPLNVNMQTLTCCVFMSTSLCISRFGLFSLALPTATHTLATSAESMTQPKTHRSSILFIIVAAEKSKRAVAKVKLM